MQTSIERKPEARRLLGLAVVFGLLSSVGIVAVAPPASAADYTWSGGGGAGAKTWSTGTNWVGNTAPTSGASIGTLTFPKLAASAQSENDLSGLSIEQLQLDNTHGLGLSGNAVTLGSGGLTLNAEETPTIFSTVIAAPLTLSSSQTWTVSAPVGAGPLLTPDDISLAGKLSGESANLTINLNIFSDLVFGAFLTGTGPDDEVGNVTINGIDTPTTGEHPTVYKSEVELPNGLNASDGKSLTVHDVLLLSKGATGPITAVNSAVTLSGSGIGAVTSTGSGVQINGTVASVNLDSASRLDFIIGATGSTPGTDYTQTNSTGAIDLGGASLGLSNEGVSSEHEFACPPPSVGQVYTLIATTGSLSGTFGNAAEGSTINTSPCLAVNKNGEPLVGRVYRYRINYNLSGAPKMVTATALPAVPTLFEEPELPAISGTTMQGQTLSLSHGYWSNEPTSYADQWQRCDTSGNNCQAITGATAPTYTLTAADVGSTIRVQETASNSEGGSEPAVSAQTAAVQAAPTGGGQNNGGGTSGGTASGGSSGGSTSSGGGTTATISSAQIATLLGQQLIPSGKAARITALLKSGGVVMSFNALEAGTLSVQWYEVPSGAKLAKKTKAKPVLVASGQMTFPAAGTGKLKLRLTVAGRKLLKHAKTVKLEAKGVFVPSGGVAVSATKLFSAGR
jgi:hypothetical protein